MSHSRKLPAIIASLALLSFVAILFFPALFQGKILAPLDITTTLLSPWNEAALGAKPHNHNPSDAVTQYLPYRIFAEKSLREDGYIGWNPYEMGGYSLAANTMALPGSWPIQLHRILEFKDAWNLGIFAEFLIAGFGMLVFLRSRGLPWLPCLIGTVAFTFNAQFIIWIYHRWALGSFCWMPWVLWAYGAGFSTRPFSRRLLLLPVFLTLVLIGGTLQHAAFLVLACACVAAADFNFRRPFANKTLLIGWVFVFIVALGISAFTIVPQISGYLTNNAIGHIRGGIGYESGFTQPLFHIPLIPARIWPWLAGDPQSIDALRMLKSGIMDLNYIGTIPMLLGFAGLFVRSMPRGAKWLIAVGLLIPLTPLVGPLYHRVELLFILGASWITSEMLGCLPLLKRRAATHPARTLPRSPEEAAKTRTSNPNPPFSRFVTWQNLLVAAVTAIGVALLIASFIPTGVRGRLENQAVTKALASSADSQFGAHKDWIASRTREWTRRFSLAHPRTAWVYGLLVLGSAGLVLSSRRHPSTSRVGHCLILCATSLELATLFQTWITYSEPADLRPMTPAIETVRTLAGPHRVLQSSPVTGFAETFAVPNLLASYLIPSIDAYESIQYHSPMTDLPRELPETKLTLAGVGISVQPAEKPPQAGTTSWPVAEVTSGFVIRRNPEIPAPIMSGNGLVPEEPLDILAALKTSKTIVPELQTMNRTTFTIPAGSTWVRIARNWHEGWQWRVRGQEWHPFLQGNDSACWVNPLPAGTDRIECRFFPRPQWLTFTSLGTALAWLGLLPFILYLRKPART